MLSRQNDRQVDESDRSGSDNDDASRQQMRVKAQCLERHQNIAEHGA